LYIRPGFYSRKCGNKSQNDFRRFRTVTLLSLFTFLCRKQADAAFSVGGGRRQVVGGRRRVFDGRRRLGRGDLHGRLRAASHQPCPASHRRPVQRLAQPQVPLSRTARRQGARRRAQRQYSMPSHVHVKRNSTTGRIAVAPGTVHWYSLGGAGVTQLIMLSWAHPSPSHKQHLDQYSRFWATVCKTVRSILSDRCLSVLSVLYVCDVGVLGPNGWMDQDAARYGGRPRSRPHCVRCRPSSRSAKGTHQPHLFGHVYCGPSVAHLSNC